MEYPVAFVIHKPVGVVCSTVDPQITCVIRSTKSPKFLQIRGGEGRPTVYSIAAESGFPTHFSLVGRLDVETSGIMLFTRDTVLDRAIRDPPDDLSIVNPFKVKEYELVLLGRQIYALHESELSLLEDEMSAPFSFCRFGREFHTNRADVKVLCKFQEPSLTLGLPHLGWCVRVRVRLQEGKNHQIRRMAKRSKLTVVSLCRTRIAGMISLDSVPAPGQCRWLERVEVTQLRTGLHLLENAEDGESIVGTCTVVSAPLVSS